MGPSRVNYSRTTLGKSPWGCFGVVNEQRAKPHKHAPLLRCRHHLEPSPVEKEAETGGYALGWYFWANRSQHE